MQWKRDSWRNFKALQQPIYENKDELKATENTLKSLPPLIFAGEVRSLKERLGLVNSGKAFLLQGGDCAESFANFSAVNIRDMFKVILQMSIVLTYAGSKPVVKIARTAGQFAKPRSSDFEEQNGVKLPSYRGDIINGFEFNPNSRHAQPERMIKAYYQSAATLNLLRAFSRGGLADLHEIHKWNVGFIKKADLDKRFNNLCENISQTLNFMDACGINSQNSKEINQTELYTSHEALLLPYEEALTRIDSLTGGIYDCSAHMLWIGERTRGIDGAHVHFLSGVENPIGVKISAAATSDEILRLFDALNPRNESGKFNIIVRMGADKIAKNLPKILREIKSEGRNIIFSTDPMHANTIKTANNYKTREFSAILGETKAFFEICRSEGVNPGGIHLEMTGQDVTECTGGTFKLSQDELKNRYETQCDPRLNANQALELSFFIADELRKSAG